MKNTKIKDAVEELNLNTNSSLYCYFKTLEQAENFRHKIVLRKTSNPYLRNIIAFKTNIAKDNDDERDGMFEVEISAVDCL